MDAAGNLYGTTNSGGNNFSGTIFELSLGSNGLWNETVLYRFSGPDGSSPRAELIMDAKGNLYGTTFSGGTNSDGVVFELSPSSGGRLVRERAVQLYWRSRSGVAERACVDGLER